MCEEDIPSVITHNTLTNSRLGLFSPEPEPEPETETETVTVTETKTETETETETETKALTLTLTLTYKVAASDSTSCKGSRAVLMPNSLIGTQSALGDSPAKGTRSGANRQGGTGSHEPNQPSPTDGGGDGRGDGGGSSSGGAGDNNSGGGGSGHRSAGGTGISLDDLDEAQRRLDKALQVPLVNWANKANTVGELLLNTDYPAPYLSYLAGRGSENMENDTYVQMVLL